MVPGALACALLVSSCGGDELLLPAEGEPAALAIVDGDEQTGPIGGQLADPLVVRVTDTRGRPVAGTEVSFATSGGSVAPAVATTDGDGLATAQWSLGMQTGAQQADVSVPDASPPLAVQFTATASAGAARGLIIVSGNGQSAPAGSTLPAPLVVRLLDASGNPISGGAISWVIGQGGGTVAPATETTAADGTTSATWTLGPAVGGNTLTAVVSGVGTVEFTATGTAAPATRLLLNGGNNQSAPAQSQLGTPLSVKAVDANGNAVAGVTVAWAVTAGGGSLSASSTTTRADGIAEVTWTLGSAVGAQTATATVAGLQGSPVTFTATATALPPPPPPPPPTPDPSQSSLSASPTSFEAGTGSSTITVTVRDGQGTPLSGVSVQLSVSGSGNSITQPGATNGSGVATGSFTSTAAETKTVSATAGGVAIQQTATVTVTAPPPPPPPTSDASQTTANVPNGVVGAATPITVQARDASGADITTGGDDVGVLVSGANNPGALPVTDNANGTYSASYTPQLTGVDAVAITLNGAPINGSPYSSTVVAPSASQLGVLAQPGNERVGRPFRLPVEVVVQDRFENVVWSSSTTRSPAPPSAVSGRSTTS
jgi:adhesin/invasin